MSQLNDINTRLFVIERSIFLEQLSSMTIAELLEISDWENSKMLGYQSSSFSFNQKLNFFIDLKSLDSEIKKKFEVIQEIRNKFAHVLRASSFENYKNISKNTADNCKKLENWYLSKIDNYGKDSELKYKYLFHELCFELSEYTIKLSIDYAYNKGKHISKQTFTEDYMQELEKIILQLPNGQKLKDMALEEVDKKTATQKFT